MSILKISFQKWSDYKRCMSNIDDFLANISEGATHIISSPKTISDLQKKGVKFETPPPKTTTQIIGDLFAERKASALTKIIKFPNTPNIAIPTIGFLYDEIRECILFGLNGAAISLSAVLVEFALKHAIVRQRRGNAYDKSEWDRLENMELGPTIDESYKLKLINEETNKALVSFKNTIRNPYLHYNIKRITKDVVARKVKKIDVATRKAEEVDLPAEDNPIVWGFAKKFADRERVLDVFVFADKIVKYLFEGKQ